MQKTIGTWPFCIAIFFALLPFGAGPEGASEGSSIRQLVWSMIFISALFVFLRRPAWGYKMVSAVPVSLVFLLFYIGLSVMWSSVPQVSFKRYVQIIGVLSLAVSVIAGSNGTSRIHRLVTPVLGVALCLSFIFSAIFPNYAFAENGLRAFMFTKNNFAQFAVLSIVFGVGFYSIEKRGKGWILPLTLAGFCGLVLSRSATVIVSLSVVAMLYCVKWLVLQRNGKWLAFGSLTIMFVVWVGHFLGAIYGYPSFYDIFNSIAQLTGRDITLTGRTYLWNLMLREISAHFWFGVGYGGFWLGFEGASGQIVSLVKWGYPGQAHNGYLDILNELGVVGLVLMFIFFIQHIRNIYVLNRADSPLAVLHGFFFLLLLILNLTEATLLRTTNLWWIVFIASVVEVHNLNTSRSKAPLAAEAHSAIYGVRTV